MVEQGTAPGKIDSEDLTFQFIKSSLIPAYLKRKDENVSSLIEELNSDTENPVTPKAVLAEVKQRIYYNYDPRGLSPHTLAGLFDNLSSNPDLRNDSELNAILDLDFPE